ncbi:tpr domain-containing protein [Diplodia corticola]|uniref:Tpr domain-containing protein n=1 Tax=Diplodia corticola TaxID=236234 RepID=A0A1J9QL24_9PEZI|nr:tpr domain-containing protein [Diplodia corticola]OJD29168.1 tpr domain-containing protein [Diplodia corticola]
MLSRAACRTALRSARRLPAAKPPATANARTFTTKTPTRPRLPPPSSSSRLGRRNGSTIEGAKILFRRHPISMTVVSAIIVFGFGVLMYAPYVYHYYIVGAFHNFPEPVAKKLRRALYFSQERSLDPKLAIKYYREALAAADEEGMDPFSNEVLGIKFQLASLFEQLQNYQRAIDILEIVRRDCLRWVDEFGDKHWNDGKRTRVLGKTIGISVKLGDLYSNQYIKDTEKAGEKLIWAVETVLREKIRREKEGVKEGEGDWITDEEMGASMEALAHHYEAMDQHYLATPLFLQALTVANPKSCHAATLMNNLAISIIQQRPPPGFGASANKISPPTTPSNPSTPAPLHTLPPVTEQARQWATKAVNLASTIAPPERDEECDMACAVATHNLGEFAEMEGRISEARRRYTEASSLAKAIGFEEGHQNSEEGIRRLGGKEEK